MQKCANQRPLVGLEANNADNAGVAFYGLQGGAALSKNTRGLDLMVTAAKRIYLGDAAAPDSAENHGKESEKEVCDETLSPLKNKGDKAQPTSWCTRT